MISRIIEQESEQLMKCSIESIGREETKSKILIRNKEGLDMLVQIRNQMQRDTVKEEKKLLMEQKKRIEKEIQLERENLAKKKNLAKELLDMSMKNKELRKKMSQEERDLENKAFKERMRNMEQTQQELRLNEKMMKTQKCKEIQDYYETHLMMKKQKEMMEKQRDKDYLQMEIDKLEKEEKDRIDFFKKIKSGYKQNHLVQKKYQEFYKVTLE